MSAFQPYAGAYEVGGERYSWRCYATARVYDVRSWVEGLPAPPAGKKWSSPTDSRDGRWSLRWLVDETTAEFSQILLELRPQEPVGLTTLKSSA